MSQGRFTEFISISYRSEQLQYLDWTKAKRMPLKSNCSILRLAVFFTGGKLKKPSRRYNYFTPATIWCVVRKRSKRRTPHSCPVIRHNFTYSTSQSEIITKQKYAQAVRFLIPKIMARLLYGLSPAEKPRILQTWRIGGLNFVVTIIYAIIIFINVRNGPKRIQTVQVRKPSSYTHIILWNITRKTATCPFRVTED